MSILNYMYIYICPWVNAFYKCIFRSFILCIISCNCRVTKCTKLVKPIIELNFRRKRKNRHTAYFAKKKRIQDMKETAPAILHLQMLLTRGLHQDILSIQMKQIIGMPGSLRKIITHLIFDYGLKKVNYI